MNKGIAPNWWILASWLGGFAVSPVAGKTPVEYANPLVGTASLDDPKLLGNAPTPGEEAYSGFTYPGPALPHRDILLGPINKDLTEAAGNHGIIFPYVHGRRTMMGFSAPMPDLTIMPIVGGWNVPPDRSCASPYDQATEMASPGYYAVFFPDSGIHVELTTTERIGYYRFTYPDTDRGAVLIDLGARDNAIEITGDHTVRGRGQRGGRCFVAEFSKPFKAFGTFRQNQPQLDGGRVRRDDVTTPDARAESGSYAGAYLDFFTSAGEPILVRIASARSYEAAQRLLDAETGSFADVWQRARSAWSEKLDLVQVKGGTEKERALFYSTLYNSLLFPKLVTKKGEPLRGRKEDGSWISPFDPFEPYYNFMMKEASGWQTLWLVPQDVQGLSELLGGRTNFQNKLDVFFNTPYNPKGIARDVTGMVGLYCQGNQPDQQAAYYYDYAGQPWNKPWFSHADVVSGGKFVFNMGAKPNPNWGSAAEAAPPSMTP